MWYQLNCGKRDQLSKTFNVVLTIALFFLLIYNPQLRIMSSGFTRYIFLFLILDLYGFQAVRQIFQHFASNADFIRKQVEMFTYACYAVRLSVFFFSYWILGFVLSGLITKISLRCNASCLSAAYAAGAFLMLILLERRGVVRLAATFFLILARSLRFRYSRTSLFSALLCAYWFALILAFYGIPLVLNTYDLTLPGIMLKVLFFIFPVTYLIVKFLQKRQFLGFNNLLKLISFTVAFQSLFIFMDWFIPAFSNFLQQAVQKSAIALRASGVTIEAGDGLSLIQALGAISSFHLFMGSRTIKERGLFASVFTIQVLSIAFVGRTGFVLVASFILFSLVLGKRRFYTSLKLLKLSVVAIVLSVSVYYLVVPTHIKSIMEKQFLPWAFEFAYSFVEKGSLNTSSTTYMKEQMLFLPEDEGTNLIGSGFFHDPADPQLNYMGTDCGYVRLIFFSGFIGSALFYTYFVILGAMMFYTSRFRSERTFIASVMLTFFISQIKFPFLFMASTHIFLMLMFFVIMKDYPTIETDGKEVLPHKTCVLGNLA